MSLLSLHDVELAFGHVALLDRISLSIERGERIGLIGRNGTGKSSLLSLIAARRQPDDGQIVRASGTRIAVVDQEPELPEGSVLGAVTEGLPAAADLIAYEHAATRVAHDHSDEAMTELADVQARLDASSGWTTAHRLDEAIRRFALDGDANVAELSGGQRKRVALARAMVAAPDLLLLDEPTNHLDVETIAWLETTLVDFAGSIIFVTHDRAFLDRVATRIIELDRGNLASYPGNYAAYRARKLEELEIERTERAKFDKVLAQEEVWIRKGIEARRTRNEGRVRRLEQLRVERAARRERSKDVKLAVDTGERSGKLVAELEDVTKSFDDDDRKLVVVRDFSTAILRGDRVGIVGPNGAGKTTLLKLILGELEPDSGRVRLGTKLAVAYFDQQRAVLDPERTLIDTISPGSEWIEIGEGSKAERKHVMSYLGDFLFDPERARSPVRTLSGGERNRLLLARLFARPANVLVLDEPTNDLDVDMLELLESLLTDYPGTIFLVSHDRAFLDAVVTQTIVSEGDGRWREYAGGYGDMEAARARAAVAAAPPPAPAPKASVAPPTRAQAKGSGLGQRERRELDALPDTIAALEAEQAVLAERLADPTLYQTDRGAAEATAQRARDVDAALRKAFERWEQLEQRSAEA